MGSVLPKARVSLPLQPGGWESAKARPKVKHVPASTNDGTVVSRRARPAVAKASRGTVPRPDDRLDEVESIARIGSYSLNIAAGRWLSSPGLDAIFGTDAASDHSVAGWASVVHPDQRQEMVAYFTEAVLGRGETFDREYRIVRADTGEARWVHGRGRLEFDKSGHPIRMQGTIADVTEQRDAQEALARSEHRYATIFDAAVEAIFVAERETLRFRWVNAAATAFLGYTRDELLSLPVHDIHPRDDRAAVLRQIAASTTSGGVARSIPCLRKDGSVVMADITAVNAEIDGVACLVGFYSDATERIASERALRDSEAHYRSLVEQSADGIFVSDRTGRYVEANLAICRMLGYSRDELLGMYTPSLRAADDPLTPEDMEVRLADTEAGTGLVVERRYRRKDGTSLVAEVSFTQLLDGRLQRTIRDTTERNRAALELRRLATAVEQSADAIVITDTDARIEYVNPAFEHVSGYSSAEVLGQNPRILNSGVQGPSFYAAMWATLASGQPFKGQLTNRRKDGTLFEEEVVISPLRDPAGAITSYVAVKRDVTELQQTRRERERLAGAIDRAVDGVILTDRHGVVTYANPAVFAALGRKPEELVGQSGETVALELLGTAGRAAILQAAADGKPWLGEVVRLLPDGTEQRLEVSVTPALNGGGAPTGFVVFSRDVTDLRKAQAEVALESRVRSALAESLRSISPDASLEEAAQRICEVLGGLPHIDVATLVGFRGPSEADILGLAAPPGYPARIGDQLNPRRAEVVQKRALTGPWSEYSSEAVTDSAKEETTTAAGIRALAYSPLVRGDRIVGMLVIGTKDAGFAKDLVEKMPGLIAFGAASSGLLAERLDARQRQANLRTALASVIGSSAFHPLFQPIVDLESRETVGFEALTRFDSGQRPDLCFADAWSVGLGAELEIATLEAAVAAATGLLPGAWLDLNVSPRLLADVERLRSVLWASNRPLVLEVTEHEPIEDYEKVRDAISSLGHDIRLAVDDAGSGVANFGHIIDLRPDFVKLDISLVRRVNAHLGRQALVVGMRHFSRTAGCRLIAEGIETPEEARTLTALGVEFGQGYLFGYPQPPGTWSPAGPAIKVASAGSTPVLGTDG